MRHASRDGRAAAAWSLVAPAGWASLFWRALVYQGARPAGQREWRWIAAYQVPLHASLVLCYYHCTIYMLASNKLQVLGPNPTV